MAEITLGGYSAEKELAAQQVQRGGKTVYIVSLPIQLVPVLLPIPDPLHPFDSNRAVRKSHADDFGVYWLRNADSWTVPPLLVDTADSLRFIEEFSIANGPKLGKVVLPDYSNKILKILDGQHRILGWNLVRDKLMKDLDMAQEQNAQTNRTGTELEKQEIKKRLEAIRFNINRMQTEQVTLEIITGVTNTEHQTFFVTIADHALGINNSERTRLDETNMTSRVAKQLTDSLPLLKDRIEIRKGSVSKKSKDLMALSNVRDIVRHTCFGIKGKVTMAREKELVDANAFEVTEHFFRAMEEAVPAISNIVNMKYLPMTLRDESLLGSVTIWRCLAGSYNDLAVKMVDNKALHWNKQGHEKFVAMLSEVHKKMKITQLDGSKKISSSWAETGCFNPNETAPRSRSQDLKNLSALFTAWAESGMPFQPKKISK
jgi:hypothetical protein